MRSRYRKTFAGFLWVIANPLIIFCVQVMVFKQILKIPIDNYPVFLLSGLLPWFFISQSINMLTGCLVSSRELLLGFKLNPLVIVSSQVLDNFFNFIVTLGLVASVLVGFGVMTISLGQVAMLLINAIILFWFVFLLTSITSMLHVYYRDVQYVASFVVNLSFFLTPIFYNAAILDSEYRWILAFNIFYPFISLFQNSIYDLQINLWIQNILISTGVLGLLSLILYGVMKKKMKDFYINV